MTRVWLDRDAGFCSGVRRAIRGAIGAAAKDTRRVVTYGELGAFNRGLTPPARLGV